MNDNFYQAFEARYRGARELIRSRHQVYLPFIQPLKEVYQDAKALDLGCGRGEWLELLQEQGFVAEGVDLNEGMLDVCHELELNVKVSDAISALKELPDESLSIVSGFHIVEHIAFEDLQALVRESLRVLMPAGLLILETPNPENILVGTSNFYLDPTHNHPIPHQLLSFLPEYYGYVRTKVLRLQEEPTVVDNAETITLFKVLHDVSPDYAVVAQKNASEVNLKRFEEVFNREFGTSLIKLTDSYERRVAALEARMVRAEAMLERLSNNLFVRIAKWISRQLRRE